MAVSVADFLQLPFLRAARVSGFFFTFADGINDGKTGDVIDHCIQPQVKQAQILLHFSGGGGAVVNQVGSVAVVLTQVLGKKLPDNKPSG